MNSRPAPAFFALAPSGPVDLLQQRVRLRSEDQTRWGRRALVAALFTWLPLLAISLIRPNSDADIPFWRDIAVHARFLVVVPLLIFAEGPIGLRSRMVTSRFV